MSAREKQARCAECGKPIEAGAWTALLSRPRCDACQKTAEEIGCDDDDDPPARDWGDL